MLTEGLVLSISVIQWLMILQNDHFLADGTVRTVDIVFPISDAYSILLGV